MGALRRVVLGSAGVVGPRASRIYLEEVRPEQGTTGAVTHLAGGRDGRWLGSSITSRGLALAMQMAVENSVVDRWFAREAGTADPRAASYRLIRVGFGDAPSRTTSGSSETWRRRCDRRSGRTPSGP
jgi:hypothetical protein